MLRLLCALLVLMCLACSAPSAPPRAIAVGDPLPDVREDLVAAGATSFDPGQLARRGDGAEVGYELTDGRTLILGVADDAVTRIEVCENPDAPKSERRVSTPETVRFR